MAMIKIMMNDAVDIDDDDDDDDCLKFSCDIKEIFSND